MPDSRVVWRGRLIHRVIPVKKYAAFDLEIATAIPSGATDWKSMLPLGISCAALALEDEAEPIVWHAAPRLDRSACVAIVRDLQARVAQGYTLLTWNGCNFDFHVLGVESGLLAECAALAADHIDLMLMFTFQQGHFLGLHKALLGAGLEGKRKDVTLNDGTIVHDMDGARAPELWARGEYNAVLLYLRDDVLQPLELARNIERTGRIRWRSASGRDQAARFTRLYTVRECFDMPEPDTSWMRSPPGRESFTSWMPEGQRPAPGH